MLFALFLMFTICRLDPETGKFEATDRIMYLRSDLLHGVSPVESKGGTSCALLATPQGRRIYVQGTPAEIIARITKMEERR